VKQTYQVQVTLAVEVEPETDLQHFQPGSWCATIVGTDWKWVGAAPKEAARMAVEHALRGGYKWKSTTPVPPYTLEAVDAGAPE
jgi:hypothetical protein